jgi:chromosome segregation ATPase
VAESSADVATLKASLGARDEQLQALVTKLTGSETEWQQERGMCYRLLPRRSVRRLQMLLSAETLETEITSLTEHIAKLDAATLMLQTELKQTHTLREETKAEVIAITADNVTLKAKIETLEAHTTTMESEHTTLKLENEELQASIAEARENLDVVDGSVEGLRVKLKKTERAHQTAVEKLDRRITRTCAEKLELGRTDL